MYMNNGDGCISREETDPSLFFLLGESLSFIFSLEEYVLKEEGSSFYRLDEE